MLAKQLPWFVMLALAAGLLGCQGACDGRGGLPPPRPPVMKGDDGQKRYVMNRGPYRAVYDRWGRVERIEFDKNGDGKPDHISHHGGAKMPNLIEIDEDFDGRFDRWEYYDAASKLIKIGATRRGGWPDIWIIPGSDGQAARNEYDEDGDRVVDRAENLKGGRVAQTEIDTNRDGRFDRWQAWRGGRIASEEIDTNGDGQPDRRIQFAADGRVRLVEKIPQR
ncbi:MAG: hypothetical protein MUF51_03905 [Vicinamibacteria bacterium]|jgi:hypothetical protein|nr:hypothetical protein [Vicinamibacteria bacterium]